MNPPNTSKDRDPFGFLPTRRPVPIVETPARWPWVIMGGLYLLASAFAAFLIFSG